MELAPVSGFELCHLLCGFWGDIQQLTYLLLGQRDISFDMRPAGLVRKVLQEGEHPEVLLAVAAFVVQRVGKCPEALIQGSRIIFTFENARNFAVIDRDDPVVADEGGADILPQVVLRIDIPAGAAAQAHRRQHGLVAPQGQGVSRNT